VSESTQWFLEQADTLGRAEGYRLGWIARAAKKMGISAAQMSQIRGGKKQAGTTLALRAALRLGIKPPAHLCEEARPSSAEGLLAIARAIERLAVAIERHADGGP
jgi:DNA-binding transcriptional regulator YdaS (Cro superfamily)